MLYEVNITRTSTATLTIRVDADDPESARGMALDLAGDQNFSGCVVDYDFDADEVPKSRTIMRRTVPTRPCRRTATPPTKRCVLLRQTCGWTCRLVSRRFPDDRTHRRRLASILFRR